MEITEKMDGKKRIIILNGRLDTTTAPELDAKIKSGSADIEGLVLDFSELEYISSAGLRVVLSAHKSMTKQGGMVISNVQEPVMEVLEATGFVDVIEII